MELQGKKVCLGPLIVTLCLVELVLEVYNMIMYMSIIEKSTTFFWISDCRVSEQNPA